MAKIGCLKPFRGSAISLANIVLENGEIAFETTNKRIYMGDGTNSISSLTPFINNGTTDISDIGTGTITNAISTLNSNLSIVKIMGLTPSSEMGTTKWRALGSESDCFIAPSYGVLTFFGLYSNFRSPNVGICFAYAPYQTVVDTVKEQDTVYLNYSTPSHGLHTMASAVCQAGHKWIPFVYDYAGSDINEYWWVFIPLKRVF